MAVSNPILARALQRLSDPEEWTDSIASAISFAVDSTNIALIQKQLEQAIQSITPVDFRNWLSSEVLHPQHTLENFHRAVCKLTNVELSGAIDEWHARLALSEKLLAKAKPVLCCGSGAVEDIVIPAEEFITQLNPTNADLQRAMQTKPGESVKSEADVITTLWQAARQPGQGLKPFLDTPRLKIRFENAVKECQSRNAELGGAQYLMARAIHSIGIEANVAWPFHPFQVCERSPGTKIKRVVIEENGSAYVEQSFSNWNPNNPRRVSYILTTTPTYLFSISIDFASELNNGAVSAALRTQFQASSQSLSTQATVNVQQVGSNWTISDDNTEYLIQCENQELNVYRRAVIAGVNAMGNDRVIFRSRRYCTASKAPAYKVICHDGRTITRPSAGWADEDWPSLPLLVDLSSSDALLQFQCAKGPALRALAEKYKRFIWNGLQALDDPALDPPTRDILAAEIAFQIRTLHDAGVQVFVEISAVPKNLDLLRKVCKDASCVGINQTELLQLSGSQKTSGISGGSGRNPAWVFPNIDQSPESLLQRYERGVRLVECFGTDVFIKGNECSLYITRSSDIARLREIVSVILLAKLVVVSSLLERAGSLVDIKPSLAEKGFMAFLQFVRDFAELFGGKDALDLMKQMFRQGYGADNMGFSCVVVPVLWPEEVQRVNSAGAGDTISGIVAALLPD